MTIEEALREAYENCTECKLVNDCVEAECRWHHIIKALENQIPKKPMRIAKSISVMYGGCPVCGHRINNCDDRNGCSECLQAIDWSEE